MEKASPTICHHYVPRVVENHLLLQLVKEFTFQALITKRITGSIYHNALSLVCSSQKLIGNKIQTVRPHQLKRVKTPSLECVRISV